MILARDARKAIGYLLPGLLFLAGPAYPLSGDKEQPLNIEADSATMDDRTGVAEYLGSVVITQGSIRILADKVTVYISDADEFDRAVAEGNPARFRQRADGETEYVRARALNMEYAASKNLLFLRKEAHVTQGADQFSGDRITYDTELSRIKAQGTEDGKQRVRITLTPKKKQPEPASE